MIQPVRAANIIDSRIGIAIGLPFSGRPIPPEFALTLSGQVYPSNIKRGTYAIKGQEVGVARCTLAEKALEAGAKYLWFCDEDLSFPPHACRELMSELEQAGEYVMACGGIYTSKSIPSEPLVYRENGAGCFWRWKLGDVFECSGLATGMMMIKTEVFKHLEKPWFKTVDDPANKAHQTEDLYFCDKLRTAGFRILADSKVCCVHWAYNDATKEFVPYYLAEDSYPMRPVSDSEPRATRHFVDRKVVLVG